MFEKDKVMYWDNASTTKVDERILKAMIPYFINYYGNASSNHKLGKTAKDAIEGARTEVAKMLGCFEDEIIFTSGATESINFALKGYVEANEERGNHIITVKTEHKAVLSTCEYLESKGCEVTYLNVDENGLISLGELREAIKINTLLISVMYVNNEIGVIQPVKEIGEIAKENNIAFFCDATQAVGKVPINVYDNHIDMLSFSGHKLKGPKGIGVLFKRNQVKLIPLIHGGDQEGSLRAGTENVPLIVGLGRSCFIAMKEFDLRLEEWKEKRIRIEKYFKEKGLGETNFQNVSRSPNIISFTLSNIEANEFLMINRKNFFASTGSACNAHIIEDSHVLRNIPGIEPKKVIRISL